MTVPRSDKEFFHLIHVKLNQLRAFGECSREEFSSNPFLRPIVMQDRYVAHALARYSRLCSVLPSSLSELFSPFVLSYPKLSVDTVIFTVPNIHGSSGPRRPYGRAEYGSA
jgi:hypothetical protein